MKHKSFLKSFQLQKNVSDLRVKSVSARRARVSYKYFLPLQVLDIQYLHECISFELKVHKSLVVNIGDFKAKSKSWYINDSTTSLGNVIQNIASQFGL